MSPFFAFALLHTTLAVVPSSRGWATLHRHNYGGLATFIWRNESGETLSLPTRSEREARRWAPR